MTEPSKAEFDQLDAEYVTALLRIKSWYDVEFDSLFKTGTRTTAAPPMQIPLVFGTPENPVYLGRLLTPLNRVDHGVDSYPLREAVDRVFYGPKNVVDPGILEESQPPAGVNR